MPQRNGQNPTRAVHTASHPTAQTAAEGAAPSKTDTMPGICAKCGADVPKKTGFRPSSIPCPKCGSLAKK
jgi:hypothetical protein